MMVTLATHLLIGVGVGLVLKIILHLKNGAPLRSLFKAVVYQERQGDEMILGVHNAAIFTNFIGLKKTLLSVPDDVKRVTIDFSNAWLVDHTVLGKLHNIGNNWTDKELILTGFDEHVPMSSHELAARCRVRRMVEA